MTTGCPLLADDGAARRVTRTLDAEHSSLTTPHSRFVRPRVEDIYRTGLENTRPLPRL